MNELNSKSHFQAQIGKSRDDLDALSAIESQLRTLKAPWVGPMLLWVIYLRRQIRQTQVRPLEQVLVTAKPTEVVRSPSGAWGTPFGLPPPDGRLLYGYRLTSEGFEALEAHLKAHRRKDGFSRRYDEALFVLWAAEWFRRGFKGGLRRWSDIGERLGLNLTQASWRSLADRGLALWGLRPLRLNGVTHRLLNLARQGGFPVAAIEDRANGWAAAYLSRLVGILLSQPDLTADVAFAHARALEAILPETWHYDGFFAVSADLALAIVRLRREAEAGGLLAGLPPSLWLDKHCPNWRDRLPLVIDSDAGRRLIDGLMTAEIVKGGSGAVRVARIFTYINGSWQPQLQFELDGYLRGTDLRFLDATWSRLRMFATGNLARYVPGELSVLEPGEGGEWISLSSRGRELIGVPLNIAVEVELRGGGERVGPTLLLGQGGAIRAPILICRDSEETIEDLPQKLELVGSASGKYRPDPLYIFVPLGWRVAVDEDGENSEAALLGDAGNNMHLWRVSGIATISSSENDRYRVFTGQDSEERDILSLSGPSAPNVVSSDGLPIYLGAPTLFVRDRGRERSPRGEEIWWRPIGERNWRSFKESEMIGTCEFAWRDRTGLLRDRQSAVILPRGFKATIRSTGDYIDIILAGCSGATEVLPAVKVENNYWRILTKGTYQASASIRFVTANLPPTVLTVRLPHRARICDWETRALPPRHRISLATLHRFVAIAAGRSELMAQLLDSNNRRIPQAEMRWIFEEELSLNTIHDDLAALLRPLGDLDASIELNFNGGYEACWHVCEFDIALASEPRGLVPTKAIVDEYARFVGRALQNPNFEMDFGPYGLSEQSSHRPISLPSSKGCWLFYIRNGNGVLTRPYLYRGQDQDHTSPDGLGFAMAIPDKLARMGRLETLCEDVESAGEKGLLFLRSIISLACGLAGLPPSTFDVFQLVARRPLLATRLLFEASEPELPALLALDASLPFSWLLIPKRYWDRAAELRFETLIAALPEILSDRLALAAGAIATARGRISAIEPTTSPLLNQSMPFKTISEAAQTFMHRAHDRVEGFALSPFRPQLTKYLPNWDFHNQYWRALDAPCAAAQAARRELRLDDGQLRCVKDVARRHPRYFLEAFSAIFREPLIG